MDALKELEPYRLSVKCPRCRSRPPFRIHRWEIDRYSEDSPSQLVGSIICRCGRLYAILARHFQEAEPDPGSLVS